MTVTADQQVTLSLYDYLELLCHASETDPEKWPAGTKDGAAWLARIREIEQDCKTQHGEWDWELLAGELQDEYDILTGQLTLMRERLNPDQGSRLLIDVLNELDAGSSHNGENGKQH